MSARSSSRWLIALATGLSLLMVAPTRTQARFNVGLEDLNLFQPSSARFAFQAVQVVSGSTIRLGVSWRSVAPSGARMPAGFAPTNPSDPGYNWSTFDLAVRSAARRGLNVLMTLFQAPDWAEGPHRSQNPTVLPGAWDPSPAQYAAFVHAAAVRYSGGFPDPLHPGTNLPHVKYWQVWNEPNLPYYLAAPHLVDEYRALLNAGYDAIKAVSKDDVVVTGGLAPVSFLPPLSVSPLRFAAGLMCLRRVGSTFSADRICPVRAHFDIFAHHPYSLAATPTKPAYRYDDVLVADMGKVHRLLRTADRLHTVAPGVSHQLWVTEWSWPTNPPNHVVGDSSATSARYVAYSMYEMWRNGVQLVIWQAIRDAPTAALLGGGLYKSSGQPKLTLSAFAFPVIASVDGGRGFVWARAPVSRPERVLVERVVGGRWQAVASTSTGSDGVFDVGFNAHGNGTYRARLVGGATSLPYDSTPIPPRRTHLFSSG